MFGEIGSNFHDFLFRCYWCEVVMSDMEDIIVTIDVAVQFFDVYYFVKDDWSAGSLIIEIFAEFVVAMMEGVER